MTVAGSSITATTYYVQEITQTAIDFTTAGTAGASTFTFTNSDSTCQVTYAVTVANVPSNQGVASPSWFTTTTGSSAYHYASDGTVSDEGTYTVTATATVTECKQTTCYGTSTQAVTVDDYCQQLTLAAPYSASSYSTSVTYKIGYAA